MLLTPPVTCCLNSRSDRRLLPPLCIVLRCAATALPLARAMLAAPGSEWSFGVFPCAPPLKTNTCLICFRLCLRFTASVPSHTFCGEASATEEVVFENATCGEPFLRRKMSFRAPEGKKTHTHKEKKQHIVGMPILVGNSFPLCFCEHCLQTECWRCFFPPFLSFFFCVWFSWVDTIKAIYLQNHSNMEWTDKRDWRESGPQQNPACPSANLLAR